MKKDIKEEIKEEIKTLYHNWHNWHNWHKRDSKSLEDIKGLPKGIPKGIPKGFGKGYPKGLPKEFLTEKYILMGNELGISILHLAAQSGQLKDVPTKFLKEEFLTKEDNIGKTVMGYAAYGGHFNQIPQSLWTKENLTTKGRPSVIVELAYAGYLDMLPEELLTKENLLSQEPTGNNCFQLCAREGHFNQIPKHLIDLEILLKEQYEFTIIDHLAARGELKLLEPKWINEKTLLNKKENPAFDSILVYAEDHKCYKQLREVLKILELKTINKIFDKYREIFSENALKEIENQRTNKAQIEVFKKWAKTQNKEIEI